MFRVGGRSNTMANTQPRILAFRVTQSVLGQAVPIIYGYQRIAPKLIGEWDFTPIPHTSTTRTGGKGFGGGGSTSSTTYTYQTAAILALCEGQIKSVDGIFDMSGNVQVAAAYETFTIPGSPYQVTVAHAATIRDDYGCTISTAYSVPVNDYGSDGATTLTGTSDVILNAIPSGTPASGQYKVSGAGVYTFAAADTGKTVKISYTYNVANSTDDGDPETRYGVTLFNGSRPQSAWSYLTTKHPSDAYNYAGLAYVANSALDLGESGTMQNMTFRVVGLKSLGGGILDANPADIISDLWTNAIYGLGLSSGLLDVTQFSNYCLANSIFLSYTFESQRTAADIINEILETTNSEAVWSDGVLKIIPYCDTSAVANGATFIPNTQPVIDLDEDDFLLESADDPGIEIERIDPKVAKNKVQIEWLNRANDFNTEITTEGCKAVIEKFGTRLEEVKSFHGITTLKTAQAVGTARVRRLAYVRNTYRFKLSLKYMLLEPMDVITLTHSKHQLSLFPVRIKSVEEADDRTLQIEAEDFPFGAASVSQYSKQTSDGFATNNQVDPGSVNTPIIFEATNRLSRQSGYEIWLGVSGVNLSNWGGCNVWISADGTTYKKLEKPITAPARMGFTGAIAVTGDPYTGTFSNFDLTMSGGTLGSGTTSDADNDRNLFCINGGEIISVAGIALVSGNLYDPSGYVRRARMGTTQAAIAGTCSLVKLDDAMYIFDYDPSWIGKTIHLKFTSFNKQFGSEQALSNVTDYTYTIVGTNKGSIDQSTGRITSSGVLTRTNGQTGQSSSPLSWTDLGSGVARINIASHTAVTPIGNVSYNSGSVSGLAYSTLYFIYASDPNWQGGAVTYFASTNKLNPISGEDYYYVGSYTTGTAGGSGGTGGGTVCTVEGTNLQTNLGTISNVEIYEKWCADRQSVKLLTEDDTFEEIEAFTWETVRIAFSVNVHGFTQFGCSETHPFKLPGIEKIAVKEIVHKYASWPVWTQKGWRAMRVHAEDRLVRVAVITMKGPSKTYWIEGGVWTHNQKPI